MSSEINKSDFTDVGELQHTEDGGMIIVLPFGKALRKVTRKLLGVRLEISFKPLKYQRSGAQNRWLWGVAYPTIVAFINETEGRIPDKEEIHHHTLTFILGYEMVHSVINGTEVIYFKGKSTSKLSTAEFQDMKEKLQAYWANCGCDIPDPKEGKNNFLSDYLEDE